MELSSALFIHIKLQALSAKNLHTNHPYQAKLHLFFFFTLDFRLMVHYVREIVFTDITSYGQGTLGSASFVFEREDGRITGCILQYIQPQSHFIAAPI